MSAGLSDVIFRRPASDDAGGTFKLIVRCDMADHGEPDSDLEDLLHDWSQIDLDRDCWLATTPQDIVIGYAAVLPMGNDVQLVFYTDPALESQELTAKLLALCEGRATGFAAERGASGEVVARTFLNNVNKRDHDVVSRAGFRPGRYFYQMQVTLTSDFPEPVWPPGVNVQTFVSGQDERPVYELIEAAFYQPARTPTTFNGWKHHMIRPEILDTDLWFLAVTVDEIIGACLGFPYPSGGWIRQLGVAGVWRRKGIGAALLSHSFTAFRRRGFEHVGLTVESERPDAHAFYRRVGMKQVRQYNEFVKTIA